jgi:hypothetical protein
VLLLLLELETCERRKIQPPQEMENPPRTIDPILNLPTHSFVGSLCFVTPSGGTSSNDIDVVDPTSHSTWTDHRRGNDNQNRDRGGRDVDSGNDDNDDEDGDDDDDDDSSNDEEVVFRSASMHSRVRQGQLHQSPSSGLLKNRFMVSCYRDDGMTLLWDLNRQATVGTIAAPRGGPGLAVRRTYDPSKVMVHTKDPKGIVSLHHVDRCSNVDNPVRGGNYSLVSPSTTTETMPGNIVRQFETFSYTFCQAVPCIGDEHLLALPSVDDSTVVIVDDRAKELVATHSIKGHGMLTSLALSMDPTSRSSDRPLLVCGMESGTAVFYDVSVGRFSNGRRSISQSSTVGTGAATSSVVTSTYELGKDPILTLDVASSRHDVTSRVDNVNNIHAMVASADANESSSSMKLLVAAGMAGDASEVADMQPEEAGRAVLFKASVQQNKSKSGGEISTTESLSSWHFEHRARFSTCKVSPTSYGKPGVSICRFRPQDGRLLAVGGWDYRIRLFDRTTKAPMGILKGNGGGSVTALDWAPDAVTSGLMVSAPANAMSILVWRCFASATGHK